MTRWRQTGALWLLLCLAVASPAWPQEEMEESQPEDEQAEEQTPQGEEEGPGEAGAEAAGEGFDIHPSYTVRYERNRDMATWNHGFNFSYGYTPRMTLSSTALVRRKSSLTAERVSRSRSASNGIDFRVSDDLTMGLKISRNWSEDVTGGGAESRKERLQEGLEINATYSTLFLGVVDSKITVGAGKEDREYADVVSRGNTERISATFQFAPVENLKTTFSYTGGLRISDSDEEGFKSRDRNLDQNVNASADYTFWEEQRISFTVQGHQTETQYPSAGVQETRSLDDRNVSISSDLKLIGPLKVGIKFSANDAETIYDLSPDRDNRKTGQGVQITVPRSPLFLGFSGNLSIHDDVKRNEFTTPQTGTTTKHALLVGLDRNLGRNSSMDLKGRMELVRYEFDEKVKNPRDRDILNQALQLNLIYTPDIVTANLSAEYKRSEQISIMPSSAGDNNTRHTYSIRPNFSMSLWRRIKVDQNYNLSADYTLYHTDESRNLLVRTASLNTGIRFPIIAGIGLNVGYDYHLQDQGSYREDDEGVSRYAKATESMRQKLSLSTGFKIAIVSIQVSQAYELKKQWSIIDRRRELKYDASSIDISGNLSASFELSEKTSGNVSVQQTQRAGRRLSENERKYWNVTVKVTHVF